MSFPSSLGGSDVVDCVMDLPFELPRVESRTFVYVVFVHDLLRHSVLCPCELYHVMHL